ncbi:bifunctional adenosylcobinamide kinase/adenosylcobinamide-phosphate guanylyltransferase [Solibacillus sp. CAU 1738]|uniref:bifunctional adenosylcobinamide kinase/adenosylcobinamide-phosphate guanylyltransferase n=1 Tax=Solibacillus sp. CAU 1738 TaxID=3140363 RepID=UPI003261110A
MHVYIGGAYNGKRKFVMEKFKGDGHIHLYDGVLPELADFLPSDIVIVSRFESIIANASLQSEDQLVDSIMERLLLINNCTTLICICTDIGRGIVPLDRQQRFIRDTCGRLYQALFEKSSTVTRIWYGLPQVLKGE